MAITKEIKIKYINVEEMKQLQVVGSTIISEDDVVIAEKDYAFHLVPTETPSERVAYQNLPDSQKPKRDELTPLWTDKVKDAWAAKMAESTP